jgi:hypothetical protein
MIREFNERFGRPVNLHPTDISISDRELLGKLLLEETLEFCVKGLGLSVLVQMAPASAMMEPMVDVRHYEGVLLDHIECADGLGDVNVVAHFCAHWLGYDLDMVTVEINESNMSKLDENGNPIINECVYAFSDCETKYSLDLNPCSNPDHMRDPSKPVGKILKGPNFRKPDIAAVIFSPEGNR